ncbi:MAG: permease [Actinomycetota bacterium]|nr:MAG: permease [Actinomycetota bacterium]
MEPSSTRTRPAAGRDLVGGSLVGLAAGLFGAVVLFGKLALREGLTVPSLLSIRFGLAAILLALAAVATGRPLLPARGEGRWIGVLAVAGYAVESALFFAAAEHGTAAAVTLLFFTYPVFVTLVSWALGGGAPARLTTTALVLAVAGTALVAATGAGLAIDGVGVLFALGAALTYTGYLLGADAALRRTHPMTSAMWVSAGASAGLLVFAWVSGRLGFPQGASGWWPLLGMGSASAAAFVALLAGLQRIGAVRTAIVAATEPLAAAILGAAFLDEPVTLGVAAGGALILAGAVAASLARAVRPQEQQIP